MANQVQTDKTDKTQRVRSTQDKNPHWACTLYGKNMHQALEFQITGLAPEFIKKVYGGQEKCPETGRLHFQGHISCRRQVRMSQLLSIFPGGHFEIARDPNKSIAYAMKKDTSSGEKKAVDNAVTFSTIGTILGMISRQLINHHLLDDEKKFHEWLIKIAEDPKTYSKTISDLYWEGVSHILANDPSLLENPGQFARTDVKAIWNGCWRVYIDKELASSITEASPPSPPSVETILSNLIIKQDSPLHPDNANNLATSDVPQLSPTTTGTTERCIKQTKKWDDFLKCPDGEKLFDIRSPATPRSTGWVKDYTSPDSGSDDYSVGSGFNHKMESSSPPADDGK